MGCERSAARLPLLLVLSLKLMPTFSRYSNQPPTVLGKKSSTRETINALDGALLGSGVNFH